MKSKPKAEVKPDAKPEPAKLPAIDWKKPVRFIGKHSCPFDACKADTSRLEVSGIVYVSYSCNVKIGMDAQGCIDGVRVIENIPEV